MDIKSLRKSKGLNQKAFAKIMGVTQATVSRWETGETSLDSDIILKLTKFFNVSADSLLKQSEVHSFEEKRLLKAFKNATPYAKMVAFFALENSKAKDFNIACDIPTFSIYEYRDYPASAGTGTYIDDAQKETLKLTKEPPSGACYVCRVSGDSMHGMYEDGDRVFVSVEPVSEGGVGIFIYNNEIYIKRAGKGCLLSENPDYPPIIIHDSDSLFCIGTVLGKVDEDDIITG